MSSNPNQQQGSLPEDSDWSPESRQQWVSMAIAAATASLRASAPGADTAKHVELESKSA